jgi:hypothetical protein
MVHLDHKQQRKDMTETFKDIVGYEGLYQISDLGNVKSLPKGDGNGNRERILKPEINKKNHTNYHRVTLSKNCSTKRFLVHRLVAEHFIPSISNKSFVNHIDNDGTNNCVTNLEWCTQVDNMKHSSDQGRQDTARYLGGVASGELRRQESIRKNSNRIGETVGKLTIIDYFYDTSLKIPKFKFKCRCSCGNITDKTAHKLSTGAQACADCTYKIRAQTRKSKDKDIVSTT